MPRLSAVGIPFLQGGEDVNHPLLDMLVHSEMEPFYPLGGNPAYAGLMGTVSLVLLPLFVWLTAQYVSAGMRECRSRKQPSQQSTD